MSRAAQTRPRSKKARITKNSVAHAQVKKWFDSELPKGAALPNHDQMLKLADQLKVFLNRANNREFERSGSASPSNAKDVHPGEVADEKIRAVVTASIELEDFSGPYLPTPDGDVHLATYVEAARRIRLLYLPPAKPKSPRGQPPVPWGDAGKQFAQYVGRILQENGYRGSVSLSNPSSAPICITSRALSWAYQRAISPNAVATAFRNRRRAKPGKTLVSLTERIRTLP